MDGAFKTYHFDYRGSTVAITDINGNVTDTFEYDTYGKLTSRTGNSDIIFLYNGRDGVVTDGNGLIYMRARYYAPELRRFINADILAGDIASGITLNRYAYANANPVSLIDPKGLSADSGRGGISDKEYETFVKILNEILIFSKKYNGAEFEFDVGVLKYYLNQDAIVGSGPIDIDKLVADQIELSLSFDFAGGTFKKITSGDVLLGIEYSADVDDYTSISASMTINRDQSTSVEYQVTTKYEDNFSIATTIGVETKKNDDTASSSPATVPDKVTEKNPSWADEMLDIIVENPLLGAVLILGSILIPGPQFAFI